MNHAVRRGRFRHRRLQRRLSRGRPLGPVADRLPAACDLYEKAVSLGVMSKTFGLAGLRIGYCLTTPEITDYLNRVRPPFNVNSLAQRAALAALEDEDHVTQSRLMNEAQMAALQEGLTALGLKVLPSEANFLYFDARRDGRQVFEALLREGVIVRHIGGRMVRVTVGLPEENSRFLQVLTNVLGHEAKA